ncbi:unnamed protein product, partial [Dicrocoelium dendriticum]
TNLIAPLVVADVAPCSLKVLQELKAITCNTSQMHCMHSTLFLDELCLMRSELVDHRRMSEAILQMLQRQSQSLAPGLSLPFIFLSELKRYDERLKDQHFKKSTICVLCTVLTCKSSSGVPWSG